MAWKDDVEKSHFLTASRVSRRTIKLLNLFKETRVLQVANMQQCGAYRVIKA